MNEQSSDPEQNKQSKLVEGSDFYFENGLMVLTSKYLEARRYCCGNGCRHCPYSVAERQAASEKKLL